MVQQAVVLPRTGTSADPPRQDDTADVKAVVFESLMEEARELRMALR